MLLLIKKAFYQQRGFTAFTGVCLTILIGIAFSQGARLSDFGFFLSALAPLFLMLLVFFAGLFFAVYCAALIENIRLGNGLRGVEARFSEKIDRFIAPDMLVMGFVGLIPMLFVSYILSIGKSMIPVLTDYSWDPVFAEWDKIIHFGQYPHQWMMPAIERFSLSGVFNFSYLIWFAVMFGSNGYALFCDRDQNRRARYLWSIILSWLIIGVVLATIFASVGPVYFGHFYPTIENPYEELMAYLQSVHASGTDLNVIRMSPVLLSLVEDGAVINSNGISAMPSMHVAIAWMIVLYMFSLHRVPGFLALLYFLLILAGSVALGWHYAIDGYVSVVLVSLIWWGCGRFIRAPRH